MTTEPPPAGARSGDENVSAETPPTASRVFVETRPSEKREAPEGRSRAVPATEEAPTQRLPAAARETPRRAAPRKPGAAWMFGGALGVFFGLLALLAFQVRAGGDPALGPAEPAAGAGAPAQRPVVIRRRIIRRVVVHHPGAGAPEPAEDAPAAAAPPPPAPAPAPAPAPLTTQSS